MEIPLSMLFFNCPRVKKDRKMLRDWELIELWEESQKTFYKGKESINMILVHVGKPQLSWQFTKKFCFASNTNK